MVVPGSMDSERYVSAAQKSQVPGGGMPPPYRMKKTAPVGAVFLLSVRIRKSSG